MQVLEELAISVQQNLISKLPFCAFNGGNDVFVDVGNKSIGLDALMRHLDCYPYEVRPAAASMLAWPQL
jgi:IMP and pyridine-specific 5'-nucleotidase